MRYNVTNEDIVLIIQIKVVLRIKDTYIIMWRPLNQLAILLFLKDANR